MSKFGMSDQEFKYAREAFIYAIAACVTMEQKGVGAQEVADALLNTELDDVLKAASRDPLNWEVELRKTLTTERARLHSVIAEAHLSSGIKVED